LELTSAFYNVIVSVAAATSTEGSGFFLDPVTIIKTVGLLGIVFIIFAESGLLVGFFLPGDSLLFTAGFFAVPAVSQKILGSQILEIWLLIPLCFLAAVAGDSVGYWTGNKLGPRLFTREESLFFSRKNILRAQVFYEKHGGKTIILARFLPIVRTFAPIVAGVGKMKYTTFLVFNIIGGFLWTVGMSMAGYFAGLWLGEIVEIDKFIIPVVIGIILLSVAPTAFHILKDKETRTSLILGIRRIFQKKNQPVEAEVRVEQDLER
jgi:membrane-associated protein